MTLKPYHLGILIVFFSNHQTSAKGSTSGFGARWFGIFFVRGAPYLAIPFFYIGILGIQTTNLPLVEG